MGRLDTSIVYLTEGGSPERVENDRGLLERSRTLNLSYYKLPFALPAHTLQTLVTSYHFAYYSSFGIMQVILTMAPQANSRSEPRNVSPW